MYYQAFGSMLFVVKPCLVFVREHGNSERIVYALQVVKLLPTLKHVIKFNSQNISHDCECRLLKSDARASFFPHSFLSAGLLMYFQTAVHQL